MRIDDKLLNYVLTNKGEFYIEEKDNKFYLYFEDEKIDIENSVKVDEEGTIITHLDYDFNKGLGFLISLAESNDKQSITMICTALNSLKNMYSNLL